MDSTNSASLQSSSGGGGDDQEYNSHGGVDHNNTNNFQNTLFDPFSNYNFNPMNNNIISPQTSFFDTINPNMFLQSNKSSSSLVGGGFFPSPATEHGGGGSSATTTTTTTITPPPTAAAPPRNPKKRSRASRRAPTTVLTTDTSNFRAMVQEFTGIPSPPFSPSYFPRTRFDHIFPNNIRSISSTTTTTNINIPFNISSQPPNYLKRPFPQKIQPQQIPSTQFLSPSLLNSIANNNIVTANSSTNVFGTRVQQNSNSLSSFLQSHEKYQVGSKDQEPIDQLMNNSSQFSASQHGHGHFRNSTIAGLPNLISPESSRNVIQGSTSSFNEEKVQESTTNGSRGEGIVESWICSSE